MAATLKLGDIWAKALDYADFTNTQYPDVARKADLVNAALTKLHYLTAGSSQNFICSTATISVVSGTEYYDLPADFYRLLKVYIIDGDMRRALRRVTFEMAHGLQTSPAESATLELNYVPVAPKFSNPPDDQQTISTNYPDGFEDVLSLEVALTLLIRAEKPTADLKAQRDQALAMVQDYLEPRDAGEPVVMVDMHQRWRRPWPFALVRPAIADIRYMLFGNKLRIFQTETREI